MKMFKASLSILVVGLVLMGAQTAWAYTFTYVGSGFFSQSEVPNIYNGVDSDSDGPYADWNASYASTYTMGLADLGDVNAGSSGYGQWSSKDPSIINITVSGNASGSSYTDNGSGSAYGGAVTTTAGYTTGIFFQISGGTTGDPVKVKYSWSASITNGDGGTAVLGGGDGTPMYISVDEFPAVGTPDNLVWYRNQIVIDEVDYQSYSANGIFTAYAGEIIGVNLSAVASINFSGSGDFLSLASNSMQLEVVPLPSSVWLFGSGLLGFLARRFRPRRR